MADTLFQDPLSCDQARLLMSLHIEDSPVLSSLERTELEAHLAVCPCCRDEYEGYKELLAALKDRLSPTAEKTREVPGSAGCLPGQSIGSLNRPVKLAAPPRRLRFMTVEESWEDLMRRCPGLAEGYRRRQTHRLHTRRARRVAVISAIAAGVILAANLVGFQLRKTAPPGAPLQALASRMGGTAFAELVTPSGRQPLLLGQTIEARGEKTSPREVLLGGMHRVVMNGGTSAVFLAGDSSGDRRAGERGPTYEIHLAQGEVYVEAAPGHSFTVRTDNALLQITGTRFDVRTQPGKTEVLLLQGSVRFSRPDAASTGVDVKAGFASSIIGRAGPTAPRPVDAQAATTWARQGADSIDAGRDGRQDNLVGGMYPDWTRSRPQPGPASLEYGSWLQSHRSWFLQEFPWTFKVQEFLKDRHGIDADYVELLMVSGDLWQFRYPLAQDQPIPVFNRAAVRRVAEWYKVDCAQLLETVAPREAVSVPAKTESEPPSSVSPAVSLEERYLAALRRWHTAVSSAVATPDGLADALLTFTLRAGTYLANTRQAAWLWIDANPAKARKVLENTAFFHLLPSSGGSAASPAEAWTASLRQQAAAAQDAAETAQEILLTPKTVGCDTQVAPARRLEASIPLLAPKAD